MSTVQRLRKLRRQCEQQAGRPSSEIELPLLLVLADVCRALRLSPDSQRRVVGRQGFRRLDDFRECRVEIVEVEEE